MTVDEKKCILAQHNIVLYKDRFDGYAYVTNIGDIMIRVVIHNIRADFIQEFDMRRCREHSPNASPRKYIMYEDCKAKNVKKRAWQDTNSCMYIIVFKRMSIDCQRQIFGIFQSFMNF